MKWVGTFIRGAWVMLCVILFTAGVEPNVLLGLPVWLLALGFSVFVHEAGHAIGAWIVGWRVVVFSVWRVAYHVQNRHFAILGEEDLQEASGWVASVPSGPRVNTWQRDAVVVAGGPIASLLQAIVAIAYAARFPAEGTLVDIEPLMLGFALLGIGLFIISAVPSRAEGRPNDGRLLLEGYRAFRKRKALLAAPCVASLLELNVRLKDVPQWMLEETDPDVLADPGYQQWLAAIEIGRTLDRSPVDVALARAQIDQYWTRYEPSDWLRSCDAYLAAANERNSERANRMIEQLGDPNSIPQMQAAARAAAFKLAGDDSSAVEWLDRMDETIAGKSPFRDFTFRDIRARIEVIEPLEDATLAYCAPSSETPNWR